MRRIITSAALALLLSTTAQAEQSKAEVFAMFMMYKKNCTTPLTKTAEALLNKYIIEVEDGPIHDAAEKILPVMDRMGVGPWCRNMTKAIAASASAKHEE